MARLKNQLYPIHHLVIFQFSKIHDFIRRECDLALDIILLWNSEDMGLMGLFLLACSSSNGVIPSVLMIIGSPDVREARLRNIIRLSRWNCLASNDGRFSGFHEPGVKLIKRQMEGRGQPVGCEGRIID